MQERVEAALADIRVMLETHGGGIELASVDEASGLVRVVLRGHCAGCPGAAATLKRVVEANLKEAVPEVQAVEAVSP